jgi:hypothetical protein
VIAAAASAMPSAMSNGRRNSRRNTAPPECPSSEFLRQRAEKIKGGLWLIAGVMSDSLQAVLQAAIGDGLSLDPFSFCHDSVAASEMGIR